MPRKRLFTPGPIEVPQAALLAMARQVRHHRTPEFRSTMSEVLEGLKYAFQTVNDVLILSCSGTGGMEAAVVNTVGHQYPWSAEGRPWCWSRASSPSGGG